jgi:hypothetical protein
MLLPPFALQYCGCIGCIGCTGISSTTDQHMTSSLTECADQQAKHIYSLADHGLTVCAYRACCAQLRGWANLGQALGWFALCSQAAPVALCLLAGRGSKCVGIRSLPWINSCASHCPHTAVQQLRVCFEEEGRPVLKTIRGTQPEDVCHHCIGCGPQVVMRHDGT